MWSVLRRLASGKVEDRDVLLLLLVLSSLRKGSSAPGPGPSPPSPALPAGLQRAMTRTGGSDWIQTRFAQAQASAARVGATSRDVAISITALWAFETGWGAGEWNYNLGNIRPVSGQAWYTNPGDSDPGTKRFAAYDSIGEGADAWVSLMTSRYGACWAMLVSSPTSDAWVTCMGSSGYYTASPATYVKGYDGCRARLATVLASAQAKAPPAGTAASATAAATAAPAASTDPSVVIPVGVRHPTPKVSAAALASQLQSTLLAMKAQGTAPLWKSVVKPPFGGVSFAPALAAKRFAQGPTLAPVQTWAISEGNAVVPTPLPSESQDDYLDRVVGGSWHPGGGGFNLFDPTTWSAGFQDAANALGIVASAFGLVGAGQWVATLEVLAGHGSTQNLANAMAADYRNFTNAGQWATAVTSGDWGKLWSLATESGTDLEQLSTAFNGEPPANPPGASVSPSQAKQASSLASDALDDS